jgi:tetratricopeptide (TPR) repeat protein
MRSFLFAIAALVLVAAGQPAQADTLADCNRDDDILLSLTACGKIGAASEMPTKTRAAAYARLCYLYGSYEQWPKVIESCTKANELEPQAANFINLSLAKLQECYFDQALEDLDRAVELNPAPTVVRSHEFVYELKKKVDLKKAARLKESGAK